MGIIAGEIEARKHGLGADPGKVQRRARQGVDLRLPGGTSGFKPTEGR